MKKVKQLFIILGCLLIILSCFSSMVIAKESVLPNDGSYHIIDYLESGKTEEFASYKTYAQAKEMYDKIVKEKNNLGIIHQGKVVLIQYGLVRFKASELCDYNVEYTNADTRENGYLNGCYVKDGLFLDTYTDGVQVKFKVAGVNAWASLDDVEIIPLELVQNMSRYRVMKGHLVHDLAASIEEAGYLNSIRLDKAPTLFNKDEIYYSYDGNYFYKENQIKEMIDDARNQNYEHAINKKTPYYNYYQYVSHRSTSVYTAAEIDDYLKDHRGAYNGLSYYLDDDKDGSHDVLTQSMLYHSATAFIQNQNLYGSNALMMLATAMNESGMGRSQLSYLKNNLFGHAAFDSSVSESASRYQNVNDSIQYHADTYISRNYLNPNQFMYHGAYFGDKQSGMNVSYASDPYWGEKAASYFYRMDDALGRKQKDAYTLGIVKMAAGIPVYDSIKKDKKVLYQVDHLRNYSFLILGKVKTKNQEYYQVQCDPLLKENKENYYRFQDHIGYIESNVIDTLVNEMALKKKITYERITFDAGKGTFPNKVKKLTMDVKTNELPEVLAPERKGYLFVKWNKEVKPAKEKTTYQAIYTKIKDVKWKKPKTLYGYGDKLDVKGCSFTLTGQDGTRKTIPLTSDMVSGYDMKKLGKQDVKIDVLGSTYSYQIEVKVNELNEGRQKNLIDMDDLIHTYGKRQVVLTNAEKKKIQKVYRDYLTYHPNPSMWEIREFEKLYGKTNEAIKINLNASKKAIGLSGMTLAFPSKIKKVDVLMNQTVKSKQKLFMKTIAKNNGYKAVDYYHMEVKADKQTYTNLDVPVIVSLPKPEDASSDDLFQVYACVDDEVIRLETNQTQNQIKFKTKYMSDFAILKQKSSNLPIIEDIQEFNEVTQEDYRFILYVGSVGIIIVFVISGYFVWKCYRKKKI